MKYVLNICKFNCLNRHYEFILIEILKDQCHRRSFLGEIFMSGASEVLLESMNIVVRD